MPPTEKRIEVIDGIEVEVLEFSDTVETVDKHQCSAVTARGYC